MVEVLEFVDVFGNQAWEDLGKSHQDLLNFVEVQFFQQFWQIVDLNVLLVLAFGFLRKDGVDLGLYFLLWS